MAAEQLVLTIAEKFLAELVDERDMPIARPAQDDAVRVLHQLAIFLLALAQIEIDAAQLFLRPLALGNVDAHADQAIHPIEADAPAGEEIRNGPTGLGSERRFNRGFTLGEDLLDALFDQGTIGLGKELQRMHGRDLGRRIARNQLEIAVPTQKA